MITNKGQKPMKKITYVAVMGSICFSFIFSMRAFAKDVYVKVDDNVIHSTTINENVENILENVGVEVSDDDKIEKTYNSDGSIKLDVKRGSDIAVYDGNSVRKINVGKSKVSDVLNKLEIKLGENDILNTPLNAEVNENMNILIARRAKIFIDVDGQKYESTVSKMTVQKALETMGISISQDDIVNVNLNESVYDGMKIIINRVKYETIVKSEAIAKNVVTKTSDLLNEGTTKVTTKGKDGLKEIKVKQTIKDGEIINSEIISSKVKVSPIDEIVIKGTKKLESKSTKKSSNNTKNTNSSNQNAKKVIYGSATAYTASKGAKTSTGRSPISGHTVAVNPNVIPYGSRILVETTDGSYKKEFVAEDTGGALRRGSAVVDIYMDSTSSCRAFGRKNVKVSIIR